MPFNWLDGLLGAILLLFAVLGARRGFARDVIGLAAAVFALVIAMWFYGTAGVLIRPHVSSDSLANGLGFLAIVLMVMIAGNLIGRVVRHFLKAVGLSFLDRLFGFAFGALKGGLLCMALLTALMAFSEVSGSVSEAVVHSQIAPPILEASRLAVTIAPMELKEGFRKQYDALTKK